jgi:hypothetical protein
MQAWRGRGAEAALLALQGEAERMERAGALQLSYSTLDALRQLLGEQQQAGYVAAQQRESRATRELDAASDLYGLATRSRCATGTWSSRRARASAAGTILIQRGNYPAARAAFKRALTWHRSAHRSSACAPTD